MNFDRYEYHYGGEQFWGNSPVKIKSQILDGQLPPFSRIKKVNRKIGIDQHPLDLNIEDNELWLKALIWPDLTARFERMEAAIELAKNASLELHQAETPETFRMIIQELPTEEDLVIYHTHVLYQFTQSERQSFRQLVDEIGQNRNLE